MEFTMPAGTIGKIMDNGGVSFYIIRILPVLSIHPSSFLQQMQRCVPPKSKQ